MEGRISKSTVDREGATIKLRRTVEYEEKLNIDQIHAKLKSQEKNLEMYKELVTQTKEKVDQYKKALAEYYGEPTDTNP